MPEIRVLDKNTIDQIAAGEVVERPSSVVKELVENAFDAGASAVTVEIRNGGIDEIRVTDNGSGIPSGEIRTAFFRHATSKIRTAEDLLGVGSLGFRGEALSSIAAVARIRLITKCPEELLGSSYEIEGGEEKSFIDLGAPDGTTFVVRDLFYNVPARRKFLKTPVTEASYIADLLEKMALSHPEVSLRFISNGSTKLMTSGNGREKDLVYTLFGRETANQVTPVIHEDDRYRITGFIGKPVLAKGNRGFENYFINGRFVKSAVIGKAIEEAYAPYLMQHRFPFTVLYLTLPSGEFDVNVHPTKMELRFQKEAEVYDVIRKAVRNTLDHKEFIPEVELSEGRSLEDVKKQEAPEDRKYRAPEPFESTRILHEKEKDRTTASPGNGTASGMPVPEGRIPVLKETGIYGDDEEKVRIPLPLPGRKPEVRTEKGSVESPGPTEIERKALSAAAPAPEKSGQDRQEDLFDRRLISEEGMKKHRLIGQVFDTYWLIQYEDKLFLMGQHAAHEKVLFERKMTEFRNRKFTSQMISPPVVVSLSSREELMLNRYMEEFTGLGYEIRPFGGHEYAISQIPADVLGLSVKELFTGLLAEIQEEFSDKKPDMILEKLASLSCKAAVKGNHSMSFPEAEELLKELMTLENPYACPHGRPTMISMTRTEIEKKFKRIV